MNKLVLFGDSLFAQAGKHRVKMFEAALPGYDVYNCAVGGWDTNDCVAKAPYIAGLKADVVVISLGTNDASPWKQVPLETFKENLRVIYEIFGGSRVVHFLPTPVDEVKITNTDPRRSIPEIEQYHDAALSVCEANGIDYINSFALFKPLLDGGTEFHVEDGVHFNDRAYQMISQELAKIING